MSAQRVKGDAGTLFMRPRGKDDYVLAIRCGRCGDQIVFYAEGQRHSPAAATDKLREMGWRWRGKRGWVCEACEYKRSKRMDLAEDWDGADALT